MSTFDTRIVGAYGILWSHNGHPVKYKLPTSVCGIVYVCECVTALSGIYYSGPSWKHGNCLTVITTDITGHSQFFNVNFISWGICGFSLWVKTHFTKFIRQKLELPNDRLKTQLGQDYVATDLN